MNTPKTRHNYLVVLSPPGTENRRYRCEHCWLEGLLKELGNIPCKNSRLLTDDELLDVIDPSRIRN